MGPHLPRTLSESRREGKLVLPAGKLLTARQSRQLAVGPTMLTYTRGGQHFVPCSLPRIYAPARTEQGWEKKGVPPVCPKERVK